MIAIAGGPRQHIVLVRVAFIVIEGGLVQLFPLSKDPPRVALAARHIAPREKGLRPR
nr:hypothetical protein [Candidatus Sigynarchaeum springense]